jgi:hypothetical protein
MVRLSYLSRKKTTDRKAGSVGIGVDCYSAYISPQNDIMNENFRVLLCLGLKIWDNTFQVLMNPLFTVMKSFIFIKA